MSKRSACRKSKTRFRASPGFAAIARESRFCSEVTHRLRLVSHHYARLFEHSPRLDVAAGSLVFTGAADDPETLETLLRLGFKNAALAAETIRGWHFGRRPAVRSARAREILTEAGAFAFASLRALGRSRRRARRVRFCARRHARGGRTFLGAESPIRRSVNYSATFLAARQDLRAAVITPSSCARCGDRSECPQGCRSTSPRSGSAPGKSSSKNSTRRNSSMRCAISPRRNCFPLVCGYWSGMIEPAECRARLFWPCGEHRRNLSLEHVERVFAAEHGRVRGGRLHRLGAWQARLARNDRSLGSRSHSHL